VSPVVVIAELGPPAKQVGRAGTSVDRLVPPCPASVNRLWSFSSPCERGVGERHVGAGSCPERTFSNENPAGRRGRPPSSTRTRGGSLAGVGRDLLLPGRPALTVTPGGGRGGDGPISQDERRQPVRWRPPWWPNPHTTGNTWGRRPRPWASVSSSSLGLGMSPSRVALHELVRRPPTMPSTRLSCTWCSSASMASGDLARRGPGRRCSLIAVVGEQVGDARELDLFADRQFEGGRCRRRRWRRSCSRVRSKLAPLPVELC